MKYSDGEAGRSSTPIPGALLATDISRSGSGYQSGFSRMPFTTPKIVELAPMPAAIVRSAISVKPGDAVRRRNTCFGLIVNTRSGRQVGGHPEVNRLS